MFDSLLGRKFSAKCKHSIKWIKTRVQLIRKKKQAMLNFLKKDVADLLLNGHDSIAFGRMDGLIFEINHISCYDMIEQYCDSILKKLSCLQKQRECPPEDREAVSTLIFAAARFSDLPELCDLRRVFTMRYGSAMESSVNPEFVDKLASKSFLMSKKLQLMRDIAQDFSVKWDSESFEQRISNPTASASDQPRNGGPLSNRRDALNGRDGTSVNGGKEEISYCGVHESHVTVTRLKQVETETKDIHIISSFNNGEPTEKTKKILVDEPENVKPPCIDNTVPSHVKPKGRWNVTHTDDQRDFGIAYNRPVKTQEGSDPVCQEGEVVEQLKSSDNNIATIMDPPYLKPKGNKDGIDKEDGQKNGDACKRSSRARERLDPSGQESQAVGQPKANDDNRAINMAPPYVKPKGNKLDTEAEDWQHKNDFAYKRSSRAREGLDPIGQERKTVEQLKSDGNKASNMVPPYIRPKANKDGSDAEGDNKATNIPSYVALNGRENGTENGIAYDRSSAPTGQERQMVGSLKSKDDRNMIPPYIRPKASRGHTEHTKSSDLPIYKHGIAAYDRSNNDGDEDPRKDELVVDDGRRPRPPRSVRRKQPKPPAVQEIESTVDGDEPAGVRIPKGQRRHGARGSIPPIEEDYDEEEEVMDKLLIHYSKKGTAERSGRPRTRTKATSTDGSAVDIGESVHPPERAISLPQDPISPKEKVKGPTRATSMQPDLLSPTATGGRVHPRLPDYDELAARFVALKKG